MQKHDLLGDGPVSVFTNHSIICRCKWDLANACVGRCGDKWVTGDAETGFALPGDDSLIPAFSSAVLAAIFAKMKRRAGPFLLAGGTQHLQGIQWPRFFTICRLLRAL
jgi:hypothetical protein